MLKRLYNKNSFLLIKSSLASILMLFILALFFYFIVFNSDQSISSTIRLNKFSDNKNMRGEVNKPKIAIITVLDKSDLLNEFGLALSTVRCYAQRSQECSHFVLITPNIPKNNVNNSLNENKCRQNDVRIY
ncbi:unnamed protein product [Meloidogyne enterolobii]|uniref:Uncharacterized protein n=1 Tax=Meloidogyne enterolobii TaxID=390850 RepID=A0ACB0XT11_MELEN